MKIALKTVFSSLALVMNLNENRHLHSPSLRSREGPANGRRPTGEGELKGEH